ncbi:hypothetical protein M3Y96_00521400 [Aphelenchoides besseyi]|nr:hypothetical protein M3Y96_00521400 [Aphelenchoides besseyi]
MPLCGHESMLEVESVWELTEPQKFWQSEGQIKTGDRFALSFLPELKFNATLINGANSSVSVYLSCDAEVDEKAFEFFVWKNQNGRVYGPKDQPVKINERCFVTRHEQPMEIHIKVVYKKRCPFCETETVQKMVNEAVEKVRVAIKEEFQLLKGAQKKSANEGQASELAEQLRIQTEKLAKAESERDHWKAKADEMEQLKIEATRFKIEWDKLEARAFAQSNSWATKLGQLERERDEWQTKALEYEQMVKELEYAMQEADEQIYRLQGVQDNWNCCVMSNDCVLNNNFLTQSIKTTRKVVLIYHQQAGEMGNVESRCALLKLRKKNEHTDFHQQEGSRSRVRFFASLLADNPTLEEYSMKGKFEAVNWLINYFYWGPSETFNNDELADNFSKYFDDLYLLSVRYSIYQLHEPFIESNMSEVALKDVHERIELAAKNEDYLLLKLLSGYLNRNGEEKKRLEDKLAKLGI